MSNLAHRDGRESSRDANMAVRRSNMAGVLFVVMPFCGAERPQIGVSTLKAYLRRERIPCDIAYFNLAFAEAVGYDIYGWITNNYSYEVFAGEWVFAKNLFSNEEIDYQGYVDEVLVKYGAFQPAMIQRVMRMASFVEPFLESCMRTIDWDRYSIVGFTSTFEQNLASLALAKRIKERYPEKIIMMGGGNCGGAMGLQLHKSFPFLDYVFTGEADVAFPQLVRRLLKNDERAPHAPGYIRRSGEDSVDTGMAPLVHDLDTLPYPDFDDFFRQFSSTRLPGQVAGTLQIETARGCWWGAKHHCTFCGLNRDEMTFRTKSSERAMDEILYLINRYGKRFVSAVDNIISMHYFKTLLPDLKRRKLGVEFFYETKANLKKEHVKLFRDAGVVTVQPGIESLSDNVLKLMRKGVTPLQNVQFLKWCREYGVEPRWNLLYGFPGENSRDYCDTLQFVRTLNHLPPPEGCGSLRLDRFSPYFDFPEQFGIRNLRALMPYRYLYPFEESVLYNLAYFFEYDFDGKEKQDRWIEPVRQEVDRWRKHHGQCRLETVSNSGQSIVVRDTRMNRTHQEYRFGNPEKSIIEFCDSVQRFPQILRHLDDIANGSSPGEAWLQGFLDYMLQNQLMLREQDTYLSLIVPRPSQT